MSAGEFDSETVFEMSLIFTTYKRLYEIESSRFDIYCFKFISLARRFPLKEYHRASRERTMCEINADELCVFFGAFYKNLCFVEVKNFFRCFNCSSYEMSCCCLCWRCSWDILYCFFCPFSLCPFDFLVCII